MLSSAADDRLVAEGEGKLIKIGVEVVSRYCHVTLQMAEVAMSRQMFRRRHQADLSGRAEAIRRMIKAILETEEKRAARWSAASTR